MVRWLPLLLVGCVWIDERDQDRLDQDGDLVPLTLDCNDADPYASRLVPDAGSLQCGSVVCGGFEPDFEPWPDANACDRIDGPHPDVLDVTHCLHPQYANQLLQTSELEAVYRIDVDSKTRVDVHLEVLPSFFSSTPDHEVPTHAVLLANRGVTCERDTCVVGLPLGDGQANTTETGADVTFVAEPGVPWLVVASGVQGSYQLSVTCENSGATN